MTKFTTIEPQNNNDMTFQKKVYEHFKSYETDEITSAIKGGLWQDRPEPRAHIMKDKQNEDLNIMPQYRNDIVNYIKNEGLKKQSNFHHLNSSQAMCLNFFYPLIEKKMLYKVLGLINPKENWGEIKHWEFEKKSEYEISKAKELKITGRIKEPTNFDFFLTTSMEHEVYFEIKYSESEFSQAGKVEGQFRPSYDTKFKIYEELLPNCVKVNREKKDFLSNYQLMRNLIHIQDNPKNYVVFLIPKANSNVARQAQKTINWVTEDFQKNVKILYWEDLVDSLRNSRELGKYYQDFYEKYLDL